MRLVACLGHVLYQDRHAALGEDAMDLRRHGTRVHGCAEDARSNRRAVAEGSRILSAYELGNRRERLWIITEADRRVTTLLLPVEY